MKIMTEMDFHRLDGKLIAIESHYQVTISYMSDLVDMYKSGMIDGDKMCDMLEHHVAWSNGNGGPDSLRWIRDEMMNKGVYSRGLRY